VELATCAWAIFLGLVAYALNTRKLDKDVAIVSAICFAVGLEIVGVLL